MRSPTPHVWTPRRWYATCQPWTCSSTSPFAAITRRAASHTATASASSAVAASSSFTGLRRASGGCPSRARLRRQPRLLGARGVAPLLPLGRARRLLLLAALPLLRRERRPAAALWRRRRRLAQLALLGASRAASRLYSCAAGSTSCSSRSSSSPSSCTTWKSGATPSKPSGSQPTIVPVYGVRRAP